MTDDQASVPPTAGGATFRGELPEDSLREDLVPQASNPGRTNPKDPNEIPRATADVRAKRSSLPGARSLRPPASPGSSTHH